MKSGLFACTLVLVSTPLCAQAISSDPAGVLTQYKVAQFAGSGTDSIQAMTSDSAGNIYVAGTTSSPDLGMLNAAQPAIGEAALVRSLDNGATWQKVPTPLFSGLTITSHPTDPQTLFAVTYSGIYKTTDSGQTWQQVSALSIPTGLAPTTIVIDPGNPLFIYAVVRNSELLRSTDGGSTWQNIQNKLPTDEDFGSFWVDPNGSGTLVVGPWLSRDHGETWSPITSPARNGVPLWTTPDPFHAGWIYGVLDSLYLSTDWGATWTQKTLPPLGTIGRFSLLIDPEVPNTLYARQGPSEQGSAIYVSRDAGNNWTEVGNPGIIGSMAFISRQCSGGGLIASLLSTASSSPPSPVYSPDFGATWQPQTVINGITGLSAGKGCALYAARYWTTDVFVTKTDLSGRVLWSTFLGGMGADAAVAVTVDSTGNVYVTGNTESNDFPTTQSRFGSQGRQNIFAVKLDPDGNLLYSAVLGGEGTDAVTALSVDSQGNAYLAGETTSTSFPTTPGVFQPQPGTRNNGFVVRLGAEGQVVYASYLANIFSAVSSSFPPVGPSPAVAILAEAGGGVLIGGHGVTLSRIAPDGSALTPVSNMPGYIYSLTSDDQGDVYVAGQTNSPPFSSGNCAGTFLSIQFPVPPGDIFVSKLKPGTLELVYSARILGDCQSSPGAISVAPNGEVVLGIWSYGQLQLHNPVLVSTPRYCAAARLSADGSSLVFSSNLDACQTPPATAAGFDESVLAVANIDPHAAILNLPISRKPMAVEQVFDSFDGQVGTVRPGMLLTIAGENLAADNVDLGLNDPDPLPTELAGTQVQFNGIAAQMLQASPDRLICIVPDGIGDPVSVQIINGGLSGTPFLITPVPLFFPSFIGGLLTRSFPSRPPISGADGDIQNADGSLNDAAHPAALGSTVTLYVNGVGLGANPFNLSLSLGPVVSCNPLRDPNCVRSSIMGTVSPLPGFISVVYQIQVTLPSTLPPGILFTTLPSGVKRFEISLFNSVGIYVQ